MAEELPVPPPTQDAQADDAAYETVESTNETVESANETVEPTEEPVEATEEPVEPTKEIVAHTKETVETTKETVETTKETVETTKETVETTKETVEPTRETVETTKVTVDSTKETTSASVDNPPDETPPPKPIEARSPTADESKTQVKKEQPQKKAETLELNARRRSPEIKKSDISHRRQSSLKPNSESLNSRARMVLGSVISIRKSDVVSDYLSSDRGKFVRYMNTYKLDSDKPFNHEKVQKILEEILLEALEGPYDEVKCPLKAKQASLAIRDKVKELEFDRYKLVCIVTIGEKHNQDVMVACRFLWDAERDRFALFSHETSHVFGVALCFGLYYE